MKTRIFFCAIIGAALAASAGAQAATLASSTFDSSLDGWTSNTPTQVTWQSSGGNPGGFMQFEDSSSTGTYVIAPSAFSGDYLTENISSISFQDDIIAETLVTDISPYQIVLSGPGGTATYIGALPSLTTLPTGWVTLSAPITDTVTAPSGWVVSSGTWQGVLANVTNVVIPIELITNDQSQPWSDIEGVDNVVLTSTAPVPELDSWALMLAGLGAVGVAARIARRKNRMAAA